jgi:hypothetical protein
MSSEAAGAPGPTPREPRSIPAFLSEVSERGWAVFPSALDAKLGDLLRADLDRASAVCRAVQVKNGLAENTDGTVHHAVILGGAFLELLGRLPVVPHLRAYFEGNFILNSFGGVTNLRARPSYVSVPHRDVRTFTGDLHLMMNMMVLLDDFTLSNGATFLLTGSHRVPDRPPEADFFSNADRLVAPAGTLVLFDSNLWHAAGPNHTDAPRRVLTLTFTRPFLKQQLDYPRALGYGEGDRFPEDLRQMLGYNARVPATLEEWYQPPERRMYKPGQG